MFDGFYLTRGFHANNACGTIHDEQTGKVLRFAHRSKRGVGSNWTGTSRGVEGDIFEELLKTFLKTTLCDGSLLIKDYYFVTGYKKGLLIKRIIVSSLQYVHVSLGNGHYHHQGRSRGVLGYP